MSELTLQRISYKDLREFKYKSFDDPFGVVAFMTDHLRETLLACPNNEDETKTALYVMTDGNIAVEVDEYHVIAYGSKLLNIPFIRGVFVFIDSLILGLKSINYSSTFYEEEKENPRRPLWKLWCYKEHQKACQCQDGISYYQQPTNH